MHQSRAVHTICYISVCLFVSAVDSRLRSLRAGVTELLNQIDLAYTMENMIIPAV